MVDQTHIVSENNRIKDHSRGMARSVRELFHDAIVLGELQWQLLLRDLRDGRRGMIAPIVAMVLGLCLALGCFPILLAALGLGLAAAGLPYWAAFLIAGGVGLLLSGAAAWGGWVWLKAELSIIERSQAEFKNNLAWIKTALKR